MSQGERRLAHDLRQSVCAMSAMLDIISQDPLCTPVVLERLAQIRHEAEWVALALHETGAVDAARRPVDVGEAVAETWWVLAEGAHCTVRLVRDHVPLAFVDAVALRRSVRNLVDNAVRAAGPTGSVEVRVRARGDRVVVEVADSGPGFGRIPTQQGLGLVTVRKFVTQAGGSLSIASGELGGALVTVELPSVVTGLRLDEEATA